jgi:AbrB family looped-hinge helix DNA binding protein
MDKTIYRTRLRNKGQVTVPQEIRNLLGAEEGDDLLFFTDEAGRVVVSRAQIIDPEQAWFWSDRWQRMEQEAQADLEAGRIVEYANIAEALAALDEIPAGDDAGCRPRKSEEATCPPGRRLPASLIANETYSGSVWHLRGAGGHRLSPDLRTGRRRYAGFTRDRQAR